MDVASIKTFSKRKVPNLKSPTYPQEQTPIKSRRMDKAVKTPLPPKNGRKPKKAVSLTTPKNRLAKLPVCRAKNSVVKNRGTGRTKEPFWVKSLCDLQTLSVPIITRSMSRCFDSWKSGGAQGPRLASTVSGPAISPATPKTSKSPPGAYRPIISRSRKLQLRQKIVNYIYGASRRGGTSLLGGPMGGKGDVSHQTEDDITSSEEMDISCACEHHQDITSSAVHSISLEASVQVDMASGDVSPTLEEPKSVFCVQYDLDPELYRIPHSPTTQHDSLWTDPQDSPNDANHFAETEPMQCDSAVGSPEKSTAVLPDHSLDQSSPEIFKSSGFVFVPRDAGSGFSVPVIGSGGPSDGFPTKNLDYGGTAELDAVRELGAEMFPDPGHVTSPPYVPSTSQILDPPAGTPERVDCTGAVAVGPPLVDRSKRSYRYQYVSPRAIKVMNLGNRKSDKPGADCLCCRDNLKHVCKCCLKIRSKLKPKTRRMTSRRDLTTEPNRMNCLEVKRVDHRKNSLDASIEAAHSVYKKLKEMIRYYR